MADWYKLGKLVRKAKKHGLPTKDWGLMALSRAIWRNEFLPGEVGWAAREGIESDYGSQPEPPPSVEALHVNYTRKEPEPIPDFEPFPGDYRWGVFMHLLDAGSENSAIQQIQLTQIAVIVDPFYSRETQKEPTDHQSISVDRLSEKLLKYKLKDLSKSEISALRTIAITRGGIVRWCGERKLRIPRFLIAISQQDGADALGAVDALGAKDARSGFLTRAETKMAYAVRIEQYRSEKGTPPTLAEDEIWRKEHGIKRDHIRDLRGNFLTHDEKKGGHPKGGPEKLGR